MKIRIKGNSVRFRLSRKEVEDFCRLGKVRERTEFDKGTFTYALEQRDDISELSADFAANTITLYLPTRASADWDTSDRVGFSNSADWNDPDTLSLLVEKDFACIDNTNEDQSDNYPNPNAAC